MQIKPHNKLIPVGPMKNKFTKQGQRQNGKNRPADNKSTTPRSDERNNHIDEFV